jgi:large subunit ribosomal protein L34
MIKRTLHGSYLKSLKVSGFLSRISSKKGKKIIKNRRNKGRNKLAISK